MKRMAALLAAMGALSAVVPASATAATVDTSPLCATTGFLIRLC